MLLKGLTFRNLSAETLLDFYREFVAETAQIQQNDPKESFSQFQRGHFLTQTILSCWAGKFL